MMSKEQTIKEKMAAFDKAYLQENDSLLAMTEEAREKYIKDIIEVICVEILRIIAIEGTIPQGLAAKALFSSLKKDAPSMMSNFMWILKPQYQLVVIKTLQSISEKE